MGKVSDEFIAAACLSYSIATFTGSRVHKNILENAFHMSASQDAFNRLQMERVAIARRTRRKPRLRRLLGFKDPEPTTEGVDG